MKRMRFAAALAVSMLTAQSALAASPAGVPCIAPQQIEDLIVFVLPTALDVAGAACARTLPRGAALSDPATAARYRAEAAAAWPAARGVIGRYGGDKGLGSLLGEDGLRSVLYDMVAKQVGRAIKPDSCRALDSLVAGLAPLPARTVAQVLVATLELSGRQDRLPLKPCPAGIELAPLPTSPR